MSIDVIIALSLAFAAWRGWRQGILMSVLFLVGSLAGIVISLKFSGAIGEWFVRNGYAFGARSSTVGFVVSFIGLGLLMRMAARLLHGILRATGLSGINRILGAAVQVFIFALIWSSLLWLGNKTTLVSPEMQQSSFFYPMLEPLAPAVFSRIGSIIPFVKSAFTEFSTFLDRLEHKP